MSKTIQNQYKPDYVSPPGQTLDEILEERVIIQAELAERMGIPKKTISEIINGKAVITPETALQLEQVLGVPASFWQNRERLYREALFSSRRTRILSTARLVANFFCPPDFKTIVIKGQINGTSSTSDGYVLKMQNSESSIYHIYVTEELFKEVVGSSDIKAIQNKNIEVKIPVEPVRMQDGTFTIKVTQPSQIKFLR